MESLENEVEETGSQEKSTEKPKLTHFLSIPINNEDVVDKFIEFKNNVNHLDKTVFIDALFQKKWKLHLTLGVLSLSNDEKIDAAKKALQESREIIENAKTRFNNPGEIRINIEGVKCMNENPTKCHVLYGVLENDLLQTMVNEIVTHFISKGLIQEDRRHVKLHVTMMNVVFVEKNIGRLGRPFDATSIIKKFGKYTFGEQKIEEIHLSKFGTTFARYYQNDGVLNIS